MKKITRYIISLLLLLVVCNLCVVVKAETNVPLSGETSYMTWNASTSYLISNELSFLGFTVI